MAARSDDFDPIAVLQALDRHRVTYIVIGALGRVIHGSDELTDGVDIVPSSRAENVRRLSLALGELNARRLDGNPLALEHGLVAGPVLELQTDAGELKIVSEPAGTRGYDDLRRAASREPLGHGVRPAVASVGDHVRMLAALNREQDLKPLQRLRRLVELERELVRTPSLERWASSTSVLPSAERSYLLYEVTSIASETHMHQDANMTQISLPWRRAERRP